MPKFADLIQISRKPDGEVAFLVDGSEFPFHIEQDSLDLGRVSDSSMPTVTVTIIANRIEVVNDVGLAPSSNA